MSPESSEFGFENSLEPSELRQLIEEHIQIIQTTDREYDVRNTQTEIADLVWDGISTGSLSFGEATSYLQAAGYKGDVLPAESYETIIDQCQPGNAILLKRRIFYPEDVQGIITDNPLLLPFATSGYRLHPAVMVTVKSGIIEEPEVIMIASSSEGLKLSGVVIGELAIDEYKNSL